MSAKLSQRNHPPQAYRRPSTRIDINRQVIHRRFVPQPLPSPALASSIDKKGVHLNTVRGTTYLNTKERPGPDPGWAIRLGYVRAKEPVRIPSGSG